MNTLLLHCRPGFEGEVCAELSEHAARLGVAGYAKGKASSACAEFVCSAAGTIAAASASWAAGRSGFA